MAGCMPGHTLVRATTSQSAAPQEALAARLARMLWTAPRAVIARSKRAQGAADEALRTESS
jgi:hypothetical protein